MLQFGPDGDLYASVGDGDRGVLNRAGAFAQRRDDLLGDIIRIDPRRGDPYSVPADNPFVAVAGRATGDLGLRAPQPVALLDRFRDERPLRARRREHVTRGDRRRRSRRTRCQLRLAVLRGDGRLRRHAPRASAPSRRCSSIRARTAPARSSAASSCATRGWPRSRAGTCTATSARVSSRRSQSTTAVSPRRATSAWSFPS